MRTSRDTLVLFTAPCPDCGHESRWVSDRRLGDTFMMSCSNRACWWSL